MGRVGENELAKAAADARLPYVQTQKANLNRLMLLQKDADEKIAAADAESNSYIYWCGWQDGITRAIKVLEGRG